MKDDDDVPPPTLKDRALAVAPQTSELVTTAALAMATAPEGTRIVAAVTAVSGQLVGRLVQWTTEKWKRRELLMLEETGKLLGTGDDPVAADRELAQLAASSEENEASMLAAAQALADAVDDGVAPAITALVVDYMQRNARADAFFRGLLRLLRDIEGAELNTLSLWAGIIAHRTTATVSIIASPGGPETRRAATIEDVSDPGEQKNGSGDLAWGPLPGPTQHARRLVYLFKAHDLGGEPNPVYGVNDGPAVEVETNLMRRLDELLNHAAPA